MKGLYRGVVSIWGNAASEIPAICAERGENVPPGRGPAWQVERMVQLLPSRDQRKNHAKCPQLPAAGEHSIGWANRESEVKGGSPWKSAFQDLEQKMGEWVSVCVCVWERERERERENNQRIKLSPLIQIATFTFVFSAPWKMNWSASYCI